MTLERHKSHLIPDVQYSLDGTLFVTDVGGTFPLRGKSARHADIRQHDFGDTESTPSFRSYDARREEKKRRYKQRSSPTRDTMTGTSTVSTNTSSLGRRLRRSKMQYSGRESKHKDSNFRYKDYTNNGSLSGTPGSTGRRLRSGPPRMTPEFADTIERKNRNSRRSLDEIIKDTGTGSIKRTRKNSKSNESTNRHRHSNGSTNSDKARYHKIHDEKLPYIVFLIDAVLLLLVGIGRIIISHWHEYYSALWAGVLALILGIIGAKHKGLYLAKGFSGAYIFVAFLTGFAMLAASGMVLQVFLPMVLLIVDDQNPSAILPQVKFTNMNASVFKISVDSSTVIWANIALDISTLIFLFVGFFSMTAAMIGFSNHWDACYDTTADCDHRGNPRLFNPIEQVSLGVATAFVGLVYIAAEAGFSNINHQHFYAPVWCSAMVIVAGIISFCFGKRIDQLAMGTFACFIEILSFATCGVATVMSTLGIVDDVGAIQTLPNSAMDSLKYKELIGMVVIAACLDFILTVNIIFIVGTIFRHFRQVCCQKCCDGEKESRDKYGSIERASKFNSIDRNKYFIG